MRSPGFTHAHVRVMRVTGLRKLIGLPVVVDGKTAGSVLRGVLARDGRSLRGVVVRSGLRGARWLPAEKIAMLGKVSLLASGAPCRMPRDASYKLFRVTDTDGLRLGVVTDALVCEDTLRVAALEISTGPVDDLIAGRWFATAFEVRAAGDTGHVTVPCKQN